MAAGDETLVQPLSQCSPKFQCSNIANDTILRHFHLALD